MANSAPSQATKRLLVVDDDPFYRDIAVSSLQAEGYRVKAVADGLEALNALNARSHDLAIVDLTMPRMDGLQFIKRLRENANGRHIPIIIMTGNDDTKSIEDAYAAGATSFVAKPINWPLFVHHVHFVMRAAQTEAELRHTLRTADFLSELKEKLLSVLVSEFQVPLRTAQGMVELMRKEAFGPLGHKTYSECAEDLHKALQQLSATQFKMMNAGRVLSQGILLKEEDVLIKDVVIYAVESQREKAERRGIVVETRFSVPAGTRIRCDRALVSQVFRLIIEGAIQFAPRNSHVTIEAKYDAATGITFAVLDNAPALPDDVIRQILNVVGPVRAEPHVSTIARNTSLTISRVLTEAHQGKMALNSTMGEGTITRITLPNERICSPAVASTAVATAGTKAAPSAPASGKSHAEVTAAIEQAIPALKARAAAALT